MEKNQLNILESVIRLIEERNRHTLEKNLTKILFDSIDCDVIVFFRVPEEKSTRYLELATCIPRDKFPDIYKTVKSDNGNLKIKPDEYFARCINDQKPCSKNSKGLTNLVYPVVVKNTVVSLLDIQGFKSSQTYRQLLDAMVRIYSNFISVLDDHEKDALTGLLNRATYDKKLISMLSQVNSGKKNNRVGKEERRAGEKTKHYWLGILDIDHFKHINDHFGHLYGDEILLHFSNLMKKVFRTDDLLFRYGGEEFVVVLQPAYESDISNIFERFRNKLATYPFPGVEQVTVSIGVVKVDAHEHPSAIFQKADKALYYAKENGRNRVCNYNELIKNGSLTEKDIKKGDIELF